MKIGDKYAIIKFGSKVSYFDKECLLKNHKDLKKIELNFTLPSDNSEILDLHFTDDN